MCICFEEISDSCFSNEVSETREKHLIYRNCFILDPPIAEQGNLIQQLLGILEGLKSCKLHVKVTNRNTRIRCEICLKLTIKTPVFFLMFLLLKLNIFHTFF